MKKTPSFEQAAAKNELEIKSVFKAVAGRVSPSWNEREAERKKAAELASSLEKRLGKTAKVLFVGSAARDTGLRGDRDIDLFATFPKSMKREEIISRTFDAARKAVRANWKTRYAEHPYLQGVAGGFKVEVIPCFRIEEDSELKSAVDRTPLHMEYLQKHLSEQQKADVRVLKQFLRNAGIYGAELEVQGFSGLVCEYLVLNYHSLLGLMAHAADNWRFPVVVDLEGKYYGEEEQLKKKFPGAEFVLVDAIDKNRNAGAATSRTNVAKFVCLCREFLKNPSEKFFFRKEIRHSKAELLAAVKRRSSTLFLVKSPRPKGVVEDVFFPQLRKSAASVAKQLDLADFVLFDFDFFADEKHSFLLFELEEETLPAVKKVQGPPVDDADACESFVEGVKRHGKEGKILRGPYVEENRVYADKFREERSAPELLRKILKKPERYAIASHVAKSFKKAQFSQGEKIVPACSSEESLQKLGNYLLRKEWWF